ncbi:glycoside hydrolase family 99-like domain-containing protein [Methylomonas sp. MgM2]
MKDIKDYAIALFEKYVNDMYMASFSESKDYVPWSHNEALSHGPHDIKLIAFYLPQFHPILENDEWWGKGFTEWTNVTKAVPQFVGHYQPRLPGELGFYDLRLKEIQKRQIEIAKNYGVYGFCYHHYWFGGKKLLERPFQQVLNDPDLDLPFCLCWANENWTRRWDGSESEVLIGQVHSPEDDLAFIRDIEPAFRDERYIRVNGKPILIVYRASLLPEPKETARRWRDYCRSCGIGEIYLIAAKSFEITSPEPFGFDAVVEFPPHGAIAPLIHPQLRFIRNDFAGHVHHYSELARYFQDFVEYPYRTYRTVVPSWDNQARRPKGGAIYHDSTPELYAEWLKQACLHTEKIAGSRDKFVFVNAWNEWAEGAYLEPDRRYGYAYLQKTYQVLTDIKEGNLNDAMDLKPIRFYKGPYQVWLEAQSRARIDEACYYEANNLSSDSLPIHFFVKCSCAEFPFLADTLDSLSAQISDQWTLTVLSDTDCPDSLFYEIDALNWEKYDGDWGSYFSNLGKDIELNWVLVFEVGVRFEPYFVSLVRRYINTNKYWRFIYFDEDIVDNNGYYKDPKFKPELNVDLLFSFSYIGSNCLIDFKSIKHAGRASIDCYEWALNILEKDGEKAIGHIADVLIHVPEGRIGDIDLNRRKSTLLKYLTHGASIHDGWLDSTLRIKYPLVRQPFVSIIIPTKNRVDLLKPCVESIIEKTNYSNYEIIVVDNQSDEDETKAYLNDIVESYSVKVIRYDKPYNYASINNLAVEYAKGEYILLLNNDTQVIQSDWLGEMLRLGERSNVGIVGPRLVFLNQHIQHAGVVLGMGAFGVADHPNIGRPMLDPGYMGRAQVAQNFSAVTAACLLIKRGLYLRVGGLDEEKFKVLFNDVDLCLKVSQLGYKIVWTPFVTLVHHGSSSIKQEKANQEKIDRAKQEADNMLEKWLPQLADDPAFNRHLSLKHFDFQLETKTHATWNVDFHDKPRVLAFPVNESGVGEYRIRSPLRALTKAAMIQSSLLPNHGEMIIPDVVEVERAKPDVLFLQNAFADHMLEAWGRYRRFNNTFMIYGQDDLLYSLPKQHPKQGQWPKDVRRRLKKMMQTADRVIVANEVLADEFKKFNTNVIVVPNYLESDRWLSLQLPEKLPMGKPRVGWAGGVEHQGDLELIIPLVIALHNEVDWVFMGMCPDLLRPYIKEFQTGVPFQQYPQKLAALNLDLAIAPLEHNKFNEAKTNLRLLEYGVLGWPVVCSDILPYRNAPVTRVPNNPDHWVRVIREKIQDPDNLPQEGQILRQWVIDHYILEDHLEQWYQALTP